MFEVIWEGINRLEFLILLKVNEKKCGKFKYKENIIDSFLVSRINFYIFFKLYYVLKIC